MKLGKVISWSNLVLFAPIWFYLAPKYHFCPYLALLTYIYHYLLYLAVFTHNYPYLGIVALNCPDFTICAIFTLYVFFHWDCTSVQNFRAIGPLVMEILNLGKQKCRHECSLDVNLVIENFLCSFLCSFWYFIKYKGYAIVKQTDHYSWRYCISKIWGYKCRQWMQFGC